MEENYILEYSIRKVELNELGISAEVIKNSFVTVAKEFGLTEQNCPTNGAFIKVDRLLSNMSNGNTMYGLFCSNSQIGFVELEDKGYGRFELEKLAVLPDYRGRGYGTVILDYAKSAIREMSGTIIKIGIIEENTRLKNWYLRNGFIHTGIKKFDHLPFTVGFMEMKV